MGFFGQPYLAAQLSLSAALTAVNYTAETAIPWDAESSDIGGWHDNVTNNTRMTVPAGVTKVQFNGRIRITAGTTTDTVTIAYKKNGGASVVLNALVTSVTSPTVPFHSEIIDSVAGDYYEITVLVSSDTSINILASSTVQIRAI